MPVATLPFTLAYGKSSPLNSKIFYKSYKTLINDVENYTTEEGGDQILYYGQFIELRLQQDEYDGDVLIKGAGAYSFQVMPPDGSHPVAWLSEFPKSHEIESQFLKSISNGAGTKSSGWKDGIQSIDLNISFTIDATNHIVKLIDKDSDNEIASFDTDEFIRDSFLKSADIISAGIEPDTVEIINEYLNGKESIKEGDLVLKLILVERVDDGEVDKVIYIPVTDFARVYQEGVGIKFTENSGKITISNRHAAGDGINFETDGDNIKIKNTGVINLSNKDENQFVKVNGTNSNLTLEVTTTQSTIQAGALATDSYVQELVREEITKIMPLIYAGL